MGHAFLWVVERGSLRVVLSRVSKARSFDFAEDRLSGHPILWVVEMGELGFVVSHPSDKNKDVARMGHPILWVVERGELRVVLSPGLKSETSGHPILWVVEMGSLGVVLSHPFDRVRRMDGARNFLGSRDGLVEGSWFPTLATKTKTSLEWGTQFCGWLRGARWGLCFPRSPGARDRGHPRLWLTEIERPGAPSFVVDRDCGTGGTLVCG